MLSGSGDQHHSELCTAVLSLCEPCEQRQKGEGPPKLEVRLRGGFRVLGFMTVYGECSLLGY